MKPTQLVTLASGLEASFEALAGADEGFPDDRVPEGLPVVGAPTPAGLPLGLPVGFVPDGFPPAPGHPPPDPPANRPPGPPVNSGISTSDTTSPALGLRRST